MKGAIALDERSNSNSDSNSLQHNQLVITNNNEENEKVEYGNIIIKSDSLDRNEMHPFDEIQPTVIEHDDDNDPDVGAHCSCFNFWDFFNQEEDETDDFVTIEFSPTEEFESKQKSMGASREQETIDKQKEKGLMLHDDVKYNDDITGKPVHSKSDELDMPLIEDISDRSSSSLSFDVNDFEETDIEQDFGMKENVEVNIYFKLTETNLPTIIEDKSFSFAVCTQFNQIFSCV